MIGTSELMNALRCSKSEAAGDYVTGLEAAAVAYVERKTNRSFSTSGERTEILLGNGRRDLWVAESIDTGETVTITETSYPGATPVTITASEGNGYEVRGTKLVRKGGFSWTRGYEYTVTYTAGYTAGEEPDDIRQAVTALVTLWYERRLPLTKTAEAEVPKHLDSILRSWRRPPAGAV